MKVSNEMNDILLRRLEREKRGVDNGSVLVFGGILGIATVIATWLLVLIDLRWWQHVLLTFGILDVGLVLAYIFSTWVHRVGYRKAQQRYNRRAGNA